MVFVTVFLWLCYVLYSAAVIVMALDGFGSCPIGKNYTAVVTLQEAVHQAEKSNKYLFPLKTKFHKASEQCHNVFFTTRKHVA